MPGLVPASGRHGPAQVSPRALAVKALKGSDPEAARQLGRLGVRAVQLLVDRFPRRRRVTAQMLCEALAQMESAGTLATLRDLRIDSCSFARLLTDHRPLVRAVAVRIVGGTGNRTWAPLLVQRLTRDPDPLVRTRLADAIGNLAAVEAVPVLLGLVETRAEPARYHAVRTLGRLGAPAWDHLVRLATTHGEDLVRRVAAETVARMAGTAAWEALATSLARVAAADVRKSVVEGLGRSGAGRAALPLLRALREDPEPVVREAAADALAALGNPAAIPALMDAALDDPCTVESIPPRADPAGMASPRRYPVREAAAEALLVVGGRKAWEELRAAAGDAVVVFDPLSSDREDWGGQERGGRA